MRASDHRPPAVVLPLAVAAAAVFAVLLQSAPSAVPQPPAPSTAAATVTVRNPIDLARTSETVSLGAADLKAALGVDDVRTVHVADGPQEVLTQAIDLNDDGKFDQLIFQTDIGPGATKTFVLSVGARQIPKLEDFKAYGRFARERRDDFAWENDRLAHRMYGAALETWAQEPLTSSTVDVWSKRVRRLIINEWYTVDDYHRDTGTGADFYSAGKSRGCGGNGIWSGDKLYPSANFRASRVLANGPIRVMFELSYEPWDAAGVKVSEVKRITLDAGQNLDHFESIYRVEGGGTIATHAAGIKKQPGSVVTTSKDTGVMRVWEPVQVKGNGNEGLAVIVDPAQVVEFTEADGNYLTVAKVPAGNMASYYAGFGWDRSGDFAGMADWDAYVAQAARRLRAPLVVTMAAGK